MSYSGQTLRPSYPPDNPPTTLSDSPPHHPETNKTTAHTPQSLTRSPLHGNEIPTYIKTIVSFKNTEKPSCGQLRKIVRSALAGQNEEKILSDGCPVGFPCFLEKNELQDKIGLVR